jgi:predicted enzyme related to lactoylglutathione lyase
MANPVIQLGGLMIQEPTDVPNGPTIALFADPDGHDAGRGKGI